MFLLSVLERNQECTFCTEELTCFCPSRNLSAARLYPCLKVNPMHKVACWIAKLLWKKTPINCANLHHDCALRQRAHFNWEHICTQAEEEPTAKPDSRCVSTANKVLLLQNSWTGAEFRAHEWDLGIKVRKSLIFIQVLCRIKEYSNAITWHVIMTRSPLQIVKLPLGFKQDLQLYALFHYKLI